MRFDHRRPASLCNMQASPYRHPGCWRTADGLRPPHRPLDPARPKSREAPWPGQALQTRSVGGPGLTKHRQTRDALASPPRNPSVTLGTVSSVWMERRFSTGFHGANWAKPVTNRRSARQDQGITASVNIPLTLRRPCQHYLAPVAGCFDAGRSDELQHITEN